MTARTIRNAAQAEAVRDLLLVSSFGLWAMLLGFVPVVAFHLVMGS
ncbi:MAG TPA: hypothetical protein VK804_14665 [Bradyrhizobium sp.]|jgi:hypothetical protein|nr:hypothetical protein [Bradyrhizobium sp.]HTB01712.1 hypothetical protein [Bradyrhizobium sp.]